MQNVQSASGVQARANARDQGGAHQGGGRHCGVRAAVRLWGVRARARERCTDAFWLRRLAAEHTKALKNVPPHSHEFVDFLSEEGTLLDLLELVQAHLVRVEDMAPAAKVAFLAFAPTA